MEPRATYTIESNLWTIPLPVGAPARVAWERDGETHVYVGMVESSRQDPDGTFTHTVVGAVEVEDGDL